MNYNENKNKIKSLSNLIENIFKNIVIEEDKNLLEEIANEENEEYKAFLQMISFNINDDIERLKIKLIPKDLLNEVSFYVEKQFSGNWKNYFKTVEIYFEVFSMENLTKCNIKDSKLYEESTVKGRRRLSRERKHNLFHASALLKLIGKKKAKYSCNTIFNEFKKSKKKEIEFIENCKIVGKDRKVFNLKDCTRTPEQLIAEKINLLKVQEKIANDNGWTWCFITLTLPGEYHPNPIKGKNTYNGVSPRDSAKIINENIKRVRSLLAKWNIKAGKNYIGCSSAEAHKDGCLHKHLLIFCDKETLNDIRLAFEWHFPNLNDDSFRINDGRAKASSYVFKYVMKSIQSYGEDFRQYDNNEEIKKTYYIEDHKDFYIENNSDIYNEGIEIREKKTKISNEEKNAILNNAFRSYNFIRGFSFFGIENCMTKFRFIARNLKDMSLPYEIEKLVIENNLYELLDKKYFDMFENVYAKEKKEISVRKNNKKEIKRNKRKIIAIEKMISTRLNNIEKLDSVRNRRKISKIKNEILELRHNINKLEEKISFMEKEKEVKSITENAIFVGCKFNGRMYFKRFFSLVVNAGKELSKKKIAISWVLMKRRQRELESMIHGLVILNHNNSRNERSSSKDFGFHALMEKRLLENIKYQINDMNYKVI